MTKLTLILTLNDPHDAYEEIVFRDSNEENFNDSVHTLRAPDNIKHTGVYYRRFQLMRIQASPAEHEEEDRSAVVWIGGEPPSSDAGRPVLDHWTQCC